MKAAATSNGSNSGRHYPPGTVLPQRADAAAPVCRRLPFQVLRSGRAPAQLSLFQGPAFGVR